MKFREGFVSNSSSCSFIIKKDKLSYTQINSLKCFHHMIVDKAPEDCEYADSWTVTNHDDHLAFYTSIDNFDLLTFLEDEGFNPEEIEQG
jgi:hypothetical protein